MTDTPQATPSTTPAATPASSTEADTRLTQVETELNALETKLKRDARITFVVSLVLLGLMTCYFAYGYSQFSALLQPKELVAMAAALVDNNVQPVRESLEAEIEKQAPVWAASLSDQALEAMPKLRETIQKAMLEQAEKAVGQIVEQSAGRFDVVLEQHRPEIANLIAELKENESASDEVMAALETAINEELGQDMQANAGEVLETLDMLTYRGERLAAGRGLSEEEQTERLFAMIVRRIQLESADPDFDMPGEMSSPITTTTPAESDAETVDPPADSSAAGEGETSTEPDATDKPDDGEDPQPPPADEKPAEPAEESATESE